VVTPARDARPAIAFVSLTHLKRTLRGRERLSESRRRLAEHCAPFLTEALAQRPLSTAREPSLRRYRGPAPGNGFVDPRDKRPEMTSEPLFRVSETANSSSHTRNCAENSDCSPTIRNIQLVRDCVVGSGGLEPAGSGPFGTKREIPKFERVRGGPGSCATARRFQQLRLSNWPNGSHGR
jgi:hypothetical protein